MTTSNEVSRTPILSRLGPLAAALLVAACETGAPEPSEVCAPEDGCDGVVDVQERSAAQQRAESLAIERRVITPRPGSLAAERRVMAPQRITEDFTTRPAAEPTPEFGFTATPDAQTPLDLERFTAADHCEDDDDPDVTPVAFDPAQCASILIHCAPGWVNYSDACGCGCEFVGAAPTDLQQAE